MLDLQHLFDKHSDSEYMEFERVQNKLSTRPDLHGFFLLDILIKNENNQDMISAAEHDEIWLNIDLTNLAEIATEQQIIDLIRCGVRLDTRREGLCMFV